MVVQEQMHPDQTATMATQSGTASTHFNTSRYGFTPAMYGPTSSQGMAYPTFASTLHTLKAGVSGNEQGHFDGSRAPFNTNPLLVLNNGQNFPNIGLGPNYGQQQASSTEGSSISGYLPPGIFPNFVGGSGIVTAGMPTYPWPYSVNGPNAGLLDHRRASWSSNEDLIPPTPITNQPDYYASLERPNYLGLPFLTSSPAMTQTYIPGNPYQHMKCADNNSYELVNLDALTSRSPAIPRAVPAMWSNSADMTLAKCLQNTEGITNVYIRGFLPDTSDDDLQGYAARFGEIESHKAIIDMETGKCKGFGFVKYYHPAAAENCIRGFFHLGYQASYAQKSRNSRLKDLEDRSSANIYCTGVPVNWNEADLRDHFLPYRAVSEKIVRDEVTGVSKEVGFARFENRETAEKVLQDFHMVTAKDSVKLSLRFADTKAQKQLKAEQSKQRIWRSKEYDYSVEHSLTPPTPLHRLDTATHISPVSQLSYHSPADIPNELTPSTSVSPPNMVEVTKSMETLKMAPNNWPLNGGLVAITNTPSYRPGKVVAPVRNVLAENLPIAPITQSKVPLPEIVKPGSGTPSPKKRAVMIENISPTGKENILATPGNNK